MKTDKKIIKIAIICVVIAIILIICLIVYLMSLQEDEAIQETGKAGIKISEKDEEETEEVEENTIIEEEDIYVSASVVKTLINNKWNRINNSMPTDYEKDEDGNYVYEGYTLYSDNGTYIKNVVFNEDYTSKVISDFTVGATYDEITEAFGTPTFEETSLNIYGYKTNLVYVFFYDDEISIYPNADLSNSSFEKLLFEYIEGNYDGNQTNFVVELKNDYEDFTSELDGDDVILESVNRQIQIRLNGVAEETEITLYNGYINGSLMEEYLSNDESNINIIEERKTDLVQLIEIERILAK